MSFSKKIRGLFGQKLLVNSAGFTVFCGGLESIDPWISEGQPLALVPSGVQEVQFPMDVIGQDNITATVQVSVGFVYAEEAIKYFNFAYDVATSSHTGDFLNATRKAVANTLIPKVVAHLSVKAIADAVKETTLDFSEIDCEGVEIKSLLLVVRPKDAQVLAALGAEKSQELIRLGKTAEQQTRELAITQAAVLRVKDHTQAMASVGEAKLLIDKQAKNDLAKAEAKAEAQAKISEEEAQAAQAMVASFNGNAAAYAMWKLATAGGDITLTSEFLATFSNGR